MCRALDQWIARAFAPIGSPQPSQHSPTPAPRQTLQRRKHQRQAQARQAIKDCERRLALYLAAHEAGADPTVVTQWINHAQRDKEAARKILDTLPAGTRKKEPSLGTPQIRDVTEGPGDIAQRMRTADTEKKAPLYEALGITVSYENATRTATVRSRPLSAYRQWLCPRGDSITDDAVVVAQAKLYR
ncbi:hypothetical protein [Streptomyces sp. Tue6028]|uniref:hypothetical protein n=1 Tax=Streptomyces sp. Tue6028 TaxID=2036037 RepID=UPI003D74F77A